MRLHIVADELVRLQLETAIMEIGNTIDIAKSDLSWVDAPEWHTFQRACYELVHYYVEQGDTVIGPMAIGEYADFTRLLRKNFHSMN
jgi:hypothetical protein